MNGRSTQSRNRWAAWMMAIVIIGAAAPLASAMPLSDQPDASRIEEIGPGKSWTSSDGTKSVENTGKVTIYLSIYKDEDGHRWYRCSIPLKGSAKVKGFNGGDPGKDYDTDSIDVGSGSAELDDCNETEIEIDGGSANCNDCDKNQIGFGEDGGKLAGDGNDRNTVHGSKQNDADVSGFNGNRNTYS
jgi:hypothetical protein